MQFTMTISNEAADRISRTIRLSGTVQDYLRRWGEDISRLPMREQEELRDILDAKLKRLEEEAPAAANARSVPSAAVPQGIQPRAKRTPAEGRSPPRESEMPLAR